MRTRLVLTRVGTSPIITQRNHPSPTTTTLSLSAHHRDRSAWPSWSHPPSLIDRPPSSTRVGQYLDGPRSPHACGSDRRGKCVRLARYVWVWVERSRREER